MRAGCPPARPRGSIHERHRRVVRFRGQSPGPRPLRRECHGGADQDVRGAGQVDGFVHADVSNQDQAAQGAADRRPERVEAVEKSDRQADASFASDEVAAEQGQGAAHEHRRWQQDDAQQQQTRHRRQVGMACQIAVDATEDRVGRDESGRRAQGQQANEDFQKSVEAQR